MSRWSVPDFREVGRRLERLTYGPSRRTRQRALRWIAGVVSGVVLVVLGTQPAAAALPTLAARLNLPQQHTGSAAGLRHQVSASATRAKNIRHGHAARPVPGAVPGTPKKRPGSPRSSFTPAKRRSGALVHPPASVRKPARVSAPAAKGAEKHGDAHLPGPHAAGAEVTADRTANTSVFRNTDGTLTARVYSRPVHYRTAGGSWADIDDTLVARAGGGWKEKADAPAADFAATGDDPSLVSYGPSATEKVSYGLSGARAVTGTVSGDAITYPGIRADSDVTYAATPSGVKETLVLHSASAPTTWTFPLRTTGLVPSLAANGSVVFKDASGAVRETIPHGFMQDANLGKVSGEGAVSTGVTYALTTSGGRPALRVTLAASWLHDTARRFPVTVDPTNLNVSSDTYVETPYDINFSTDDTLKVGSYDDGAHKADSYLLFSSVGSTFKNDYIEKASLFLDNVWSGGCTPEPVNVSPITSSWSVGTIADYPGLSYGSKVGYSSFSAGASCDGSAWHGIDIGDNPSASGVGDVENWAHGGGNLGFALTADNSVVAAWKQFASVNSSYPPYLSVTYSGYGADYTVPPQSYTPPTASTTGSMQVQLTNRGTTSWTTSNMKLGASIYNTSWTQLSSEATKTAVPSTVAANSSVTMTGSIPEVAPGEYYVCWDMLLNGTTSFYSTYNVPMGCAEIISADTPPQIDSTNPLSAVALGSLTPELSASGEDPDGYPGSGITYDFQVYSNPPAGTPALLADSGALSTTDWVVPSGTLDWNQSYYWTVSDSDGDASSAWSDPSTFSTAVPQPLITSHLGGAADDGSGRDFDPQVGNYTTTATDADVSVVGPPLDISRSYNSLDPRTATLFGAGWSTPYDMSVQPDGDGTGNVVVTGASGQQQRFGLNGATGAYTAPAGQFETLTQLSGGSGWSLAAKSGTTYTLGQQAGAAWKLTGITDSAGHAESLHYGADGTLATVTNTTSDRALHLTWSGGHVTEVDTDPATSGGTPESWTYSYSGDELTTVCPPTSTTACTGYSYTSGSHYRSAVLDANPSSYWRFADSAGTTATSEVAVNEGNDKGTYSSGVTLGAAGPLPGSPTTAATFNGSSGYVTLPPGLADSVTYATVSMWFKTSGAGVLFSYQKDAVTNATTPGNYTPVLYVGTSGKLYGELWRTGGVAPISTGTSVADGDWHQVVLTGAGTTQSLYVDGSLVGTLSGQLKVSAEPAGAIGAGFIGGKWPDQSHYSATDDTGYLSHFSGQIAEAAFYTHALGTPAVQQQYAAGTHAAGELDGVTLPSGKTRFQASYDAVHDRANLITDADGQTWAIGNPTTTGSGAYYRNAVLSSHPFGYWRLGESSGTDATDVISGAGDELGLSSDGTYNNVTLGTPGPFTGSGETAATFNGTSGYVSLPEYEALPWTPFQSVEMWFKTTHAGGVLFSYQSGPIGTTPGNYTPALYVGSDGHLYGQFWDHHVSPMESPGKVTDGNWHQVALTTESYGDQVLYLDGKQVDTRGGDDPDFVNETTLSLGAGYIAGSWPAQPANAQGYFNGSLAETSFYGSVLSDTAVAAHFAARGSSTGAVPVTTATVTDPTAKTLSYAYDPTAGGRLISATDALGGTTSYAYDGDGFLASSTDPDGLSTTATYNDRGDVLSRTDGNGDTSYYAYPAAGTYSATDPRDDQPTGYADARSYGPADPTYATAYTYNAAGNPLSSTDPDQHASFDTYTDGTEAAVGGGTEPAGLLATEKDPRGEVTSYSYDSAGDLAQVVTPSGLTTNYAYDGLGRRTRQTRISDTFPSGVTTAYTYDADNRPATQTGPATTDAVTGTVHTPQTTDSYDDDGDLTGQTVADTTGGDPTRPTTWHYDSHDRVDSTTDPAGRTTTYGYDDYGNVNARTNPDGDSLSFQYSPTGELLTTTLDNYTGDPEHPSAPAALVIDSRAYDPAGVLADDTDAMGRQTEYQYDDADRLASEFLDYVPTIGGFQLGQVGFWTYDAAGNLTESDYLGQGTDYTLDPAGLTTSSVFDLDQGDANLNRVTDYVYDQDGNVKSATETGGGDTQESDYAYDALGDRTSQSVQNGTSALVTSWTYDERGLPTSVTDPRGNASGADPAAHTTDFAYDQAGQLTQRTDPVVQAETYGSSAQPVHPVTLYGYDTFGDRTTVDDPDGDITTYTYDADSDQLAVSAPAYTPPGASTSITPTQTATYNADGQPLTTTDGRTNTTHYTYDQLGDLTQTVEPEVNGSSPTSHSTYDKDGELSSFTDPTGAETDYTYDDFGQPITVSQVVRQPTPVVDTTQLGYDTSGNLASVTAPGGQETDYDYDAAGDQLSVTDPLRNTTDYAYNLDGEVTQVTLPDQTATANTYDEAGRLTATANLDASGHTLTSQQYGYDEDGNPTSFEDADQHTTHYTYDALGNLTGQTEPVTDTTSIETSFGYDAAGQQTRYTDGAQNATYTTYNPLGLPESTVEPATADFPDAGGRTTTVSYDADGEPATLTRPGGVTQTSVYDADGNLTSQTGTGAEATTPSRSFGYDADGRVTSAGAPGGTDTYVYDDLGDVLSASGPSGNASYAYNDDGQLTSRTDRSGTAAFTYNDDGDPHTATDPLTGTTSTYSYNNDEQLTGVGYGAAGSSATQAFGYNDQHQLTSDDLTTPGGATEASVSYGYDNDGRLQSQTTTGTAGANASTYGYDQAGRLTSWNNGSATTSYGYDADGNRNSVTTGSATATANYDQRDELTGTTSGPATTSYGYTARGTLSSVTTGASTEHLTDDAFDQLTADGATTYTHDDLGRLATAGGAAFTYDGTGDDTVSDGTETYGHDSAGNLTSISAGGTAALALTDQHGDLTGTFTATGSALAGSSAYDPFGQTVASTGTQHDLGYQGGWTDPSTGRLATASRWYDPTTADFTSQDTTAQTPVPSVAGNGYAYGDDDPLDAADPSGDSACSPDGYSPGPAYSYGHSPSGSGGGSAYHYYNWASKTSAMDYEQRSWFAGPTTSYGHVPDSGTTDWGAYRKDVDGGAMAGGSSAILGYLLIGLLAGYSSCDVVYTPPPPPPPTAQTGLHENPGARPVGQATGKGTHAEPGTKSAATGPGDAAPAHPTANPGADPIAHTPALNTSGGTASMTAGGNSGGLGTTLPIDPEAGSPTTLVNPADPVTGSTLTTPVASTAGGSDTAVFPIDPNASVAAISTFPAALQAGHTLLKVNIPQLTVQQAQPGWTLEGRLSDAAALRDQQGLAATGAARAATWTAGVHLDTGEVGTTCSGTIEGGAGQCAEPNLLALTGWDPARVVFTRAMRREDIGDGTGKVWQEKEICKKCQVRYSVTNFVEGVLAHAEGVWEQ